MPYGQVASVGLLGAWTGQAIRELRDQHLRADFSTLPLCAACDKTLKKPQGDKRALPLTVVAQPDPS